MRPLDHPIQCREDQCICQNFIELRRMQWNAERDISKVVRFEVAEGNRPGTIALRPPATARRETAQPSNGLPGCEARRKHIAGLESRQPVMSHIHDRHHQREQKAALINSSRLQRAK